MPTTKTTARKTKPDASRGAGADAVALLEADHKEVKQMFKAYGELVKSDGDSTQKQALAEEICASLTVHATIEEEIFYPAVRQAIDEQDLLDEAEVEHASCKDLITQIQSMDPDDELYDARVTVLGEYIEHHVKEEEGEMFPKAKKAKLDTAALGAEMMARKDELTMAATA